MRVDPKAAPVARRVHKRGLIKKAHFVSPNKCPGVIQCESRLEASGAIVMGLDPRVVLLRPQPVTFDLDTGRIYASREAMDKECAAPARRRNIYTPDFEAHFTNKKAFVEFKHSALIKMRPKTLELPSVLRRFGYRLIIVDETYLPEVFVQNMRLLSPLLNASLADADRERIACASRQPVQIRMLLEDELTHHSILSLIAQGRLVCDLMGSRLSGGTRVVWSEEVPRHLMHLPFDEMEILDA
ncbi:hypothetical protein [Pontibaca salina]|uniref:TnsA endonuclease N-terminal domain-containing protein n=1 Tax=Pontibaca salina TaxID=2795731 RepID=A0A934HUG3_9RHOB|nr:hypothetical protein [Pontibaca salina]MBI6630735.1 hypothetical protein [Pontibaca salina]